MEQRRAQLQKMLDSMTEEEKAQWHAQRKVSSSGQTGLWQLHEVCSDVCDGNACSKICILIYQILGLCVLCCCLEQWQPTLAPTVVNA
jgi:hypothetical protein